MEMEEQMKQNDCTTSRYEQDPSTSRLKFYIHPPTEHGEVLRSNWMDVVEAQRERSGRTSWVLQQECNVQSEIESPCFRGRRMDHDRFSGWDSNVFSTNNNIADNGGEEQGKAMENGRTKQQKKTRTSSAYYSNTNEKTRAHIILDISMHQPYT